MPDLLLSTKFFIPGARTGRVTRPRLLKSLDKALTLPITIISAPPGFGKTTLLADWVAAHQEDQRAPAMLFAWLSLDVDDNNLARFWTYAITALQKALGRSSPGSPAASPFAEVLNLLASALPPYQVFLTLLINGISSIPQPVILILDDYHLLQDAAIAESMEYLVDHSPANLHLVIASRTDPTLPLGRWRARGQLHNLRAIDLRFSLDEASEFLNRSMGLSLSQENVAELDQRTEGWAAGLQMAAFALQDQDETSIARAITVFSGRHYFLLDYFTDEILQRQTQNIQHFLLRTSILDRMCAELCAVVMEDVQPAGGSAMTAAQAQALLERLERANLFVVPLDSERRWYRYHHLFNDLLRARLRQTVGQEGEAGLHRRAAGWHARQGHLSEAIHQALQAQDFDLAAHLIEEAAASLSIWDGGEVATLLKWIQALPPGVIQDHLWLRLYQSRSVYFTGQVDASEAILDEIEQLLRAGPVRVADSERLLGMTLAHRARYASVRGQIGAAAKISRQALEMLSPSDSVARNFVLPNLAYSAYLMGDVEEAARLYTESANISRRVNSRFGMIGTLANLARTRIVQGRLRDALQLAQETIREGVIQGTPLPVTGWPRFPLAEALYEQNLLVEAETCLSEGLRLVEEGRLTGYYGLMPALLARVQMALGREDEAQATMEAALASARRTTVAVFMSEVEAYQARLWLRAGELSRAVRWAEEYQASQQSEHLREIEDIALAEVLLAAGRAGEAQLLLTARGDDARRGGRLGREISIRAILAMARQALGDAPGARVDLERALSLGAPEGYLRPFLDLGEPMARLLQELAGAKDPPGGRSEYVAGILEAFPPQSLPVPPRPVQSPQLVEPLTPREIDVLRLLAEGLSNREIAGRLYLSPNTLRVYTTNLYAKLEVHNRTQAVTRAQALGLL